MKKSTLIQILVSLLAIAVVLYLSDFDKVLAIIWRVNLFYLFASMLVYLAINILMGFRIRMLLNDLNEKISLADSTEAGLSGMLASDFTPGRTGYFATAFLITANSKIKLHKSMLSIFGPQLFEFAFKCIAGAIAMWYILELISYKTGGEMKFVGMIVGFGIFLAMVVLMALLLFSSKFVKSISFIRMFPYGDHTHSLLSDMQRNSRTVRKFIPQIAVLLAITWALKSLEWLLVAKSVGMQVNSQLPEIIFFAFLQPLITMLQFIPAPTLAGMGLSEGGAAAVLYLFGVPPYESVAFALLTRSMNVMVDLLGIKGAVKVIDRIS